MYIIIYLNNCTEWFKKEVEIMNAEELSSTSVFEVSEIPTNDTLSGNIMDWRVTLCCCPCCCCD